jgi:predicted Zn-dependent protease
VSDEGGSDDSPGYLSSHPQTRERIDEAEFAGEKFAIEHPELYRERPDYDACAEDGICEDAESEEMDSDEVYECVDDDCERVEPDASLELQ